MESKYDPIVWNAYAAGREHSPFLQSYEWGTFQEKRGFAVQRLEYEGGAVQATRYPITAGYSYWYAPYHPILDEDGYQQFFKECQESELKSVFVRFEPQRVIASAQPSEELTPSTTLILSLAPESEELLSNMHSKTRYNIGLSKRKEVSVECILPNAKGYADTIERVIDLFRLTGERQSYRVQTRNYFKTLLSSFSHDSTVPHEPSLHLYCAWYRDTLLGAILVMYFGDTATYLYGGSASEYREMMSPYALQWTALQEARSAGYRYYDFWGIAPSDDPHHPWAGITRFKKGFGGEVVSRPGTFDFVLKPNEYKIYTVLRKLRRTLGGAQNN